MLKGDLVMAYTIWSEKPTTALLTPQGPNAWSSLGTWAEQLGNSNLAPTVWRIPGEQTMFTPH